MKQVLERRDQNWDQLQDFVFREEEILDLKGIDEVSVESFHREYIWFYQDGVLSRRLVAVDGITLSASEERRSVYRKGEKKGPEKALTREAFFDFEFEPGNYFFSGKEKFQGREVVVIEYYPEKLFENEENEDEGSEFVEAFKKTTLVRLWVFPEERQLVKMVFENIGLEFLPYRWLVRIDDLNATIILDKPIPGVWLPTLISASGAISTANASLSISYERRFFDYKEAEVEVRLKYETENSFPKPEEQPR